MALARRQRANQDIWPGFVDALATLLMVIIFLLMIFVVSQLYLNEALVGRDRALERLNAKVSELADILALEREDNASLRREISTLSSDLRASLARESELEAQLSDLRGERASLESQLAAVRRERDDLASERDRLKVESDRLSSEKEDLITAREALEAELEEEKARTAQVSKELEDAYKTIDASEEKISIQLQQLARLERELESLEALRDELKDELASKVEETDQTREELLRAEAEAALMNERLEALRRQLNELTALLETYEERDEEQKAQIADLGKRLNVALASKVQELARYRSEFFGRLREILGDREDIRVVGDRFVFQSEVLFGTGSAELGPEGKLQLTRFSRALDEITGEIPAEIDWVLQVNGHTDAVPINTARFPSNWELSAARAISVVKFLEDQGIDPNHLAAAGFGEHQPIDPRDTAAAYLKNRRIELKLTQR